MIRLRWDEGQLLVFTFTARAEGKLVAVHLDGFEGPDAAGQAIDAMSGFTLVLAFLRNLHQHGLAGDLIYDRFPDHDHHDR